METSVVILTLRIGASGLLVKDGPAERVTDAVRVAAAGDPLLASITRRLNGRFAEVPQRSAQSGVPERLRALDEAELETPRSIARGLSNQEIAAEPALAEETVRDAVDRLLDKLGLRDRIQAVVLAYETGFVSSEV